MDQPDRPDKVIDLEIPEADRPQKVMNLEVEQPEPIKQTHSIDL